MGKLLGKTLGRSHSRHAQRETLAHPSLGRAKRTLPNVSAENHQEHWLAQPSHSRESKRWFRHGRQPRAPSSKLPPAITQPRFTRGETASCEGRWKGLSCLTRKFHEQFLGGGVGGNITLLPDTDVKDAEWIAELVQHGLLRASFVPPRPQRELREVTRYRSKLVQERARLKSSIQKVLEDSNVKLASVATDITGVSGRAILRALLDGEDDPEQPAELARGRLRSKRGELAQAVQGTLRDHHRFLLTSQLRQLDFYDLQIAELDQEIARRLGVQTGQDDPEPQGDGLASDNRTPSTDSLSDGGADPASRSPRPPSDPARSQAEVIRILYEVTA